MKQYVARLLVFLCIISFTPMKEVIKAPLIVIHYLDHLEEMPEMTWKQFYFMHYTIDIHFDEDYEQDRQLPFKTFEYSQIPTFLISADHEWPIRPAFITHDNEQHLNAAFSLFIEDAKLKGIFHPPRFS
ncbi:MAG: hypothetical protein IPK35_12180 [Saprospiraceae bacterium]|jgi:hypothetical protein|nr:hypothetical protein [Saprospiraceae bacterium]